MQVREVRVRVRHFWPFCEPRTRTLGSGPVRTQVRKVRNRTAVSLLHVIMTALRAEASLGLLISLEYLILEIFIGLLPRLFRSSKAASVPI